MRWIFFGYLSKQNQTCGNPLVQPDSALNTFKISIYGFYRQQRAKGLSAFFWKSCSKCLKDSAISHSPSRKRSSPCSSRPTTKTKFSRSKSKASRCYRIFGKVVPLSRMRIWWCCCFARLWRSCQPTKRAVIRPTGWALSSLPSTLTGKQATYISITTPAWRLSVFARRLLNECKETGSC